MSPRIRCNTSILALVAVALGISAPVAAQAPRTSSQSAASPAPPPDMRVYYMVFLRRGPAWTTTDPAVKAGRFVYEIVPWWGLRPFAIESAPLPSQQPYS